MSKTEVYSWRVSPALKAALEEAARIEKTSVARLLDRIVEEWLPTFYGGSDSAEEQRRLHAGAEACIGKLEGGAPDLAQDASRRVREELEKRYVSQGSD